MSLVAYDIKSKICNVCSWHENKDVPVRDHTCLKNHVSASGGMEPLAILDMTVDLYNRKNCVVNTVVTDDDSSIKAKLKWSNEDYMKNNKTTTQPTHTTMSGRVVPRPDKGGLPGFIPEPSFLADPNHRKKTLKGALYGTLKKKKAERFGLTKVDVIRVTNNFAYMMRGLHQLPSTDDFEDAGKAVLEHHFDCHDYCRSSFCKRMSMTQEERDADTDKIYRCKTKDSKLYSFLKDLLERFVSKDKLLEVGHGMDTQVNESLNNSIAWLAPKNKTYAGSQSLTNRVCIAIGIQSLGSLHYFTRLLEDLGIDITPDVKHYLTLHAETRDYRITKAQDPESKRLRNTAFHAKLKEATVELKGAIAKRDGLIYQPGIGMNDGYDESATAEELDCLDPPSKKKRRKIASTASRKCSACGEAGHNRSNRMCKKWSPRGATRAAAATTTTRDLEEQHLMDQMMFAADQDIVDGSAEEGSSDSVAHALSCIL